MKLRVMLMVAMLALSGVAIAETGGNSNGNGCINNCGKGGDGGTGGVGGHGGTGGNGGVGNGGAGGDAIQGQLQGQAQGQLQGQAQSATSVALAGAAAGAAVVGSGNSGPVTSTNTNSATGGNATGGNSTATGGNATASNAGNSQSITYNEATNKTVRSTGTVEVRSVPTAIAPNVYPTASCAMSASVGASALGWGVSGGGTKVNEECMQLEAARMFAQLGYPVQGIILACSTKSALAVFGTAQACVDASTPKTAAVAVEPTAVVAAQPVKVETTVPFGEVK